MLKYNSSNSKQKFHGRKCNLKKKWNEHKKNKCSINTNKYYNTSMCACEIKKNSKKIIGDSVVKCDKTVDAVARS